MLLITVKKTVKNILKHTKLACEKKASKYDYQLKLDDTDSASSIAICFITSLRIFLSIFIVILALITIAFKIFL